MKFRVKGLNLTVDGFRFRAWGFSIQGIVRL
jgi:hypothetical protein